MYYNGYTKCADGKRLNTLNKRRETEMSKLKRMKDVTVGVVLGGVLFSGVSYAASTSIDVNFQPLKYFFDGVEKKAPADQQGFMYKGTTYVPLRFVSEALGKKVGYDGKTSSIYVGKQKEGTITYITSMKTLTSDASAESINSEFFTTNTGEKYYHFLSTLGWGKHRLINEYVLNGNYNSFEALIAPSEPYSSSKKVDNLGHVIIYGDNEVLFDSGAIATDIMSPIKVDVSLKDIVKLKIEIQAEDSEYVNGGYLGLLDAKLIN